MGGDNYPGADLAGEFFNRNVRIYTNLLRAVDVQHDRAIVLIIGQGHVAFLKSILQYNSLFEAETARYFNSPSSSFPAASSCASCGV